MAADLSHHSGGVILEQDAMVVENETCFASIQFCLEWTTLFGCEVVLRLDTSTSLYF
jgi:hypothetical protein